MPDPLVPLFGPRIRVIDSWAEPPHDTRDPADDGPPPIPGGRPKGCKRLHTNATVAAVRRLIEQTTLSYQQIGARTGVSHGTVGRWTREGGWKRHLFAPRASDTVPTARAGRRLKLRMLGAKLHALAERCATELWNSETVDLDRLIEAMQVLKMARFEAMGSRRPPPFRPLTRRTGRDEIERDDAILRALRGMRWSGVIIDRIPDEAMALLEEAHTPPERDDPAFRPRGARRRK